ATNNYDLNVTLDGTLLHDNVTRDDGAALTINNNAGTITNLSRFASRDANGSDFSNLSIFRTNVGLAIGINVEAYSANLDTWATKAVTATQTELNYVGGVTSAIQTQLNGKQANGSYALSGANIDITSLKSPQINDTNANALLAFTT